VLLETYYRKKLKELVGNDLKLLFELPRKPYEWYKVELHSKYRNEAVFYVMRKTKDYLKQIVWLLPYRGIVIVIRYLQNKIQVLYKKAKGTGKHDFIIFHIVRYDKVVYSEFTSEVTATSKLRKVKLRARAPREIINTIQLIAKRIYSNLKKKFEYFKKPCKRVRKVLTPLSIVQKIQELIKMMDLYELNIAYSIISRLECEKISAEKLKKRLYEIIKSESLIIPRTVMSLLGYFAFLKRINGDTTPRGIIAGKLIKMYIIRKAMNKVMYNTIVRDLLRLGLPPDRIYYL